MVGGGVWTRHRRSEGLVHHLNRVVYQTLHKRTGWGGNGWLRITTCICAYMYMYANLSCNYWLGFLFKNHSHPYKLNYKVIIIEVYSNHIPIVPQCA